MRQHKDPPLEPVAGDIATLALDLLLRETGYQRGAASYRHKAAEHIRALATDRASAFRRLSLCKGLPMQRDKRWRS